jgi:hypothetical protein
LVHHPRCWQARQVHRNMLQGVVRVSVEHLIFLCLVELDLARAPSF